MDSKNDQNSGWAKVSDFDPIPNEQPPVAPMETVVATPAVAPKAQPVATPTPTGFTQADIDKHVKNTKTLAIVMSIVAVIFLGLGVWGLVSSILKSNDLQELAQIADTQAEIISEIENQTGAEITSVETLPTYEATTGYIYISEWGVKIQIPEDLNTVSYILNQNYRPSICFNAVIKGNQYFPPFADITKNPGGMGCLTRVSTDEGAADTNGNSFGEQVFTNDGYNYFYTLRGTYSSDSAELGLENSSIAMIKSMLTNNVSAYK